VSSASNVNGAHKKNLSVVSTTDRSVTPDFAGDAAKTTTSVGHADPTNPTQVPVPIKEDIAWEQWSGLDLGGIRIKNLSSAMFSFTHLTSLYINHNVLTSIPPAINNLRHLTLLDATGNELTSIPPELGVLWRLKELLLFDNHLTTLPAELGSLYKLEMLGIEGNPMDERYRKILAEEGTEALIHHLRDTCAPGPGPPERQWITIEPDISSPSEGPQESFTVLTYNILCDSYAPTSSYTYTPKWALDWSYRKQTLLNEIATASADVVCLQEIDGAVYKEFFYPQLQAVGYDGCHYSRTRGRHMGSKDSDMVDGCATFWKKDK
jgi:CCR4-NOT transcription complex subunit 6